MHDIVITEFIDAWAVDELARDFRVYYDPELVDKPGEIMALAAEVPALIVRNRTQVRGDVLTACRQLKVIGRLGVGLDNIDMDECTRRGIRVFPASGANTASVAEYVIAAMLIGLRDVWHASEAVVAGKWPRNELMFREASGKRLGLIGFGEIARAVARRARGFELEIVAHDPGVSADHPAWRELGSTPIDLATLLATSDVVSMHVPLLPSTRNLVDRAALARMKPGAILINTSRGGTVDEAALVAALREGRLGGAVLDVFASEPLAKASIFVGAPRLWLTPHIAGVTEEANRRVSSMTVANVRKALTERGR